MYEKKTVTTSTGPTPQLYETRYHFETFGRLLRITYPDLEVVTNVYDSGGNLQSASGVKAVAASGQNHRYRYLHNLFYDKFEQRAFVEQGDGVKTAYAYNAQTRRLQGLTAMRQGNLLFQNLAYTYDKVGNITRLQNVVDVPPPNVFGGPTNQSFVYDDLYRLTHADGTFQYSPSKTHTYNLDLTYDTIHNIQRKNQLHQIVQPSTVAITQKKTTYDFTYMYAPSGPASVRPHAPTHIGERTFTYDANGNQTGWTHDQNGTRRNIVWDDDNRIQSLFDNGHEKTYKYDDQGNRLIKRGPQGETVYVNQFFTDRPGATGTKHVYAGTTRIASKLMRQDAPNANPQGNTPFEKDLYFYHPDYLGSSSFITDLNGKLYEHLEYFPFGEGWVEENSNVQRTPYHFTAKELDEETGLYYFGARYYDPRTSVWQSADPALDKYLPSFTKRGEQIPTIAGGVFVPGNLGLYSYSRNNPLTLVDANGQWPKHIHDAIIEKAFPGLSTEQRQVLKDRSQYMDRIPAGHTAGRAAEHAMRRDFENKASARRNISSLIRDRELGAKRTQGEVPESVNQIKPEGLRQFGDVLHTVTDRTSPVHTDAKGDPKAWPGIPTNSVDALRELIHAAQERNITPEQMDAAGRAAQESFGRTFGEKALKEASTPPPQP